MKLRTTIIEPPKAATGSIIWLHGLGADGDDFVPVVPHMQLPDIRFVFPHAPLRSVTVNGGVEMPAWFDILSLTDSPDRESLVDIEASAMLLDDIIQQEIDAGIPSNRIIVMGFSQGGAMALHVGLRFTQPLLGLVVMSGYLVKPNLLKVEESFDNKSLPILFCHGTRDLVVPYRKGKSAFEFCFNKRRDSVLNSYPVGHEVCMEELADIRLWVHQRYALTDSLD
ncbi:MAG: dienelactone hydrolase family protein [Myxococcota bacterium]|nr:dienelactone hydrolase family protein [Myxococcota bacterium]